MIHYALLCIGAVLFDTLIGDPRGKWHPVVMIGNLIAFLEGILLKPTASSFNKKVAGALLATLTVGSIFAISYGLVHLLTFTGKWGFIVGNIIILSFTISPRALKESAMEIYYLLLQNDLVTARQKVSWIVGRDTENLDETELARATVETVAENITDGIISPLFYALIGGVPLACAYRAVNTLDSMVGYKNDKYIDFGMFSARLDDVCNFIPARITAVLILLASLFLPSYSVKNSWRILWRDAQKHPSPNSGYAEAPVAGALNVRLGGCNYYFGKQSFRAYMGDQIEVLNSKHIKKTVVLMYFVTILFVIIPIVMEAVWNHF